jgi:hypothetical protein
MEACVEPCQLDLGGGTFGEVKVLGPLSRSIRSIKRTYTSYKNNYTNGQGIAR